MDDTTKSIIEEYKRSGQLTSNQWDVLEKAFATGILNLSELQDLHQLYNRLSLSQYQPSESLDSRMLALIERQPEQLNVVSAWQWTASAKRYAAAVWVLIGIGVGWYTHHFHDHTMDPSQYVLTLQEEVDTLKDMVLASLLLDRSSAHRLQQIKLVSQLPEADSEIIQVLFTSLNQDPSTNVRLAALDALQSFTLIPEVRSQLLGSIAFQKSPMVQIGIAKLLKSINEVPDRSLYEQAWDQENMPKAIQEDLFQQIKQIY